MGQRESSDTWLSGGAKAKLEMPQGQTVIQHAPMLVWFYDGQQLAVRCFRAVQGCLLEQHGAVLPVVQSVLGKCKQWLTSKAGPSTQLQMHPALNLGTEFCILASHALPCAQL